LPSFAYVISTRKVWPELAISPSKFWLPSIGVTWISLRPWNSLPTNSASGRISSKNFFDNLVPERMSFRTSGIANSSLLASNQPTNSSEPRGNSISSTVSIRASTWFIASVRSRCTPAVRHIQSAIRSLSRYLRVVSRNSRAWVIVSSASCDSITSSTP